MNQSSIQCARLILFMDGWWILVGMMGSGKSTVGKRLAELLGVDFRDTDVMVQHRLGRPVHQLFSILGEEAFRGHETSILKQIPRQAGVLATGGGIVLRSQNWEEFCRLGKVIFMNVDLEVLKKRLAQSKKRRPLLETEHWEDRLLDLSEKRRELYQQANYSLQIGDEELSDVAQRLYEEIQKWT